MQKQNRLYVHCGFPKTGSTALQAALRASEAPLREAGFLYPYAGSLDCPNVISADISYSAHHNLSWELTRNRWFDSKHGDLATIAGEIEGFSGSVILSCEGLETTLAYPDSFDPIINLATQTGRNVTLIVYLRNQLSYCEAMYQELLKDGLGWEYGFAASLILETGSLAVKDFKYQFDYERILESWRSRADVNLIVRNYHALAGGSTITDFAQLIGVNNLLKPRLGKEKVNSRDTNFGSLCRFYQNRFDRKSNFVEQRRMEHLTKEHQRLTSSLSLQQKFINRFQASNMRVCETLGIPSVGLDMKDSPRPPSTITFEQFFSFETACAIRTGQIPDTSFAPPETRETGWMAGIETAGTNIPLADTLRYRREKLAQARRWYTSKIKNRLPFTASSESR